MTSFGFHFTDQMKQICDCLIILLLIDETYTTMYGMLLETVADQNRFIQLDCSKVDNIHVEKLRMCVKICKMLDMCNNFVINFWLMIVFLFPSSN